MTTRRCVCVLPCTIWDRPIVKFAVRSSAPYLPLPNDVPYSFATRLTCVPGCQYVLGRQCTWRSDSHAHAPSVGTDVLTVSAFCTAALSVTSRSNVIAIGMATP